MITGTLWKRNSFIYGLSDYAKKVLLRCIPTDNVPYVKNLHIKINQIVNSEPSSFDMGSWHYNRNENIGDSVVRGYEEAYDVFGCCGTQHCWAGWAINLAGLEGYKLEYELGQTLAALCIMKKSDPKMKILPDFYLDEEDALIEIDKLAKDQWMHGCMDSWIHG